MLPFSWLVKKSWIHVEKQLLHNTLPYTFKLWNFYDEYKQTSRKNNWYFLEIFQFKKTKQKKHFFALIKQVAF